MMTPQEVASSTFPKSTIGGYNMAAVDVFLDKLTEDYSALHKENAALKAKIKVLVDKMEEYHAMEDTMRSTLLTAQKMATNMVSDAEQKANSVLAAVENTARERTRELQAAIADEEQRLVRTREEVDAKIEQEHSRLVVAQRELTAFINASRKLCSRQLELIDRLPELDVLPNDFQLEESVATQQPAVAVAAAEPIKPQETAMPEPVKPEPIFSVSEEIDNTPIDEYEAAAALAEVNEELGGDANSLMQSMQNVIDAFSREENLQTPPVTPAAPAAPVAENPFDFADTDNPFEDEEDEDPFQSEDPNATRVLNLRDLQFGRNYTKD
ncbi:MAG: DivIVA domain-containing protein [Oscillospiraceae bacterium]|nr:DivIVA domain-containing protein [Oscillospiraceae bacterium]